MTCPRAERASHGRRHVLVQRSAWQCVALASCIICCAQAFTVRQAQPLAVPGDSSSDADAAPAGMQPSNPELDGSTLDDVAGLEGEVEAAGELDILPPAALPDPSSAGPQYVVPFATRIDAALSGRTPVGSGQGVPQPPPVERAAVPNYRPPAGVRPTQGDALVRSEPSACPASMRPTGSQPAVCGRLCNKTAMEVSEFALQKGLSLIQSSRGKEFVLPPQPPLPPASDLEDGLAPSRPLNVAPSPAIAYPGDTPADVPDFLDYIGHTDCLPMCAQLMEQCCTFCLYSSWSFAVEDEDSSAARRTCLAQCPKTIEQRFRRLPPHDHPLGTTTTTTPAPPPVKMSVPVSAPPPPTPPAPLPPAPAPLPIAPAPAPAPVPVPAEITPLSFDWASADESAMEHPKLPPFPAVTCTCTDECRDVYELCTDNCLGVFGAPSVSNEESEATKCYKGCSDQVCKTSSTPPVVVVKFTVEGIDYAGVLSSTNLFKEVTNAMDRAAEDAAPGVVVKGDDLAPGSLRVTLTLQPVLDPNGTTDLHEAGRKAAKALQARLQYNQTAFGSAVVKRALEVPGLAVAITGGLSLTGMSCEVKEVSEVKKGVLKAIPVPTPWPAPPPCPPSVWQPEDPVIVPHLSA
eukprot:TRINITY_DN35728_c0_g1_i2.p1 TRINITY_DN35728_c0_g1~~TRINITY_DN35728_c0_g1_i2.p1  ORF type:complete len:653 (-),score=91.05 TRINITY_DN35728_c0_g1_i2:167-2059(-)